MYLQKLIKNFKQVLEQYTTCKSFHLSIYRQFVLTHIYSHLLNCVHFTVTFQGLLVGLHQRGKEREMRFTIDN